MLVDIKGPNRQNEGSQFCKVLRAKQQSEKGDVPRPTKDLKTAAVGLTGEGGVVSDLSFVPKTGASINAYM